MQATSQTTFFQARSGGRFTEYVPRSHPPARRSSPRSSHSQRTCTCILDSISNTHNHRISLEGGNGSSSSSGGQSDASETKRGK